MKEVVVMDFKKASELLTGRCKDKRKLKLNTYLERISDSEYKIKFHDTYIITIRKNGEIILDSGGWKTQTTKERINEFTPYTIRQDKGVWYLHTEKEGTITFYDGISINKKGKVKGTLVSDKRVKHLQKKVLDYSKKFAQRLVEGKIPAPSSGDCWYCSMRTVDGNKPLGDAVKSDHILQHLKDNYFVPTLLYNAVEDGSVSMFVKGYIGELWRGNEVPENYKDIVQRDVEKILKKYLRRKIGLVA
jgi:hypothetical protein